MQNNPVFVWYRSSVKMSLRLQNAVLVLALSAILTACPSSGPNGNGGAEPPATSPTVPLTVTVEAAGGAPDDYGLVPGDTIAGAKIEVNSIASSDVPSHVATTDDSGRAVLMVRSGTYRVSATKDTHDPNCWWHGGAEVEVADKPVTVKLDEVWVQCE